MAVNNPLLDVQDIVAAKIETTTGTAISLAAADGVFNVLNPRFTEDVPEIQRKGQGSASALTSISGPRSGRISFRLEAVGKGASGVPAWASTFLVACGMTLSTATYSFSTGASTEPTLTIGKYEDGVFRSISGAKGNFSITAERPGAPVYFDFEFLGKLEVESDVPLIAPTYPTVIPPRWANNVVTVGAYAPLISRFTFNANNELYLRPDPAHITGYRACCIPDRNPDLSMDPEATLLATKDWQADLFAHTAQAISIAIGDTANNIITIATPAASLVKKERGSRNKVRTNELMFRPARNSSAGDDEVTIAFT